MGLASILGNLVGKAGAKLSKNSPFVSTALSNPLSSDKLLAGGVGALGGMGANWLRRELMDEEGDGTLGYALSGLGGAGLGLTGLQATKNYLANRLAHNAQTYNVNRTKEKLAPSSLTQVLRDAFEVPNLEGIRSRIKDDPSGLASMSPEALAARAELFARMLGSFDKSKGSLFVESDKPIPAWFGAARPGDTHLNPTPALRNATFNAYRGKDFIDIKPRKGDLPEILDLRKLEDLFKAKAGTTGDRLKMTHPGIYSNLTGRVRSVPEGYDVDYADRWDFSLTPGERDKLYRSIKNRDIDRGLLLRAVADYIFAGQTAPVVSGTFKSR